MDYIELGYEYSLEVPEIDLQHKDLAAMLNDAIKHCTGRKNDEKTYYKKNMKKFFSLLKTYYDYEEKILGYTKYENLGKHKADHKKIIADFKKVNDDIEKKKMELNLFYVTASIKESVMKHIKIFDVSAKEFFIEGNKKMEEAVSAKRKH